jgi:hypothetical protein
MGAPEPTPPECEPLPGASYRLLTIVGEPSGLPAAQHPDINLALRGITSAQEVSATLLDNCTSTPDDTGAPQLRGLFADHRRPTVVGAYWVYQWDWDKGRPASGVECTWGASHITVAVTPGEILRVPSSDYCIDETHNLNVLVLYATPERITLKYTREDNVIAGYTLHLEGLCVDPALVALYEQADSAGRRQGPALQAGQAFARARAHALGISTRDCGAWMDPRNCADWWRV